MFKEYAVCPASSWIPVEVSIQLDLLMLKCCQDMFLLLFFGRHADLSSPDSSVVLRSSRGLMCKMSSLIGGALLQPYISIYVNHLLRLMDETTGTSAHTSQSLRFVPKNNILKSHWILSEMDVIIIVCLLIVNFFFFIFFFLSLLWLFTRTPGRRPLRHCSGRWPRAGPGLVVAGSCSARRGGSSSSGHRRSEMASVCFLLQINPFIIDGLILVCSCPFVSIKWWCHMIGEYLDLLMIVHGSGLDRPSLCGMISSFSRCFKLFKA